MRFGQLGKQALSSGVSLLMCPEGRSQEEAQSPGHFHSGAFRLAADTGYPIVPVAIAGFGRRFKDGPLVAVVGEPLRVEPGNAEDPAALRTWIEDFQRQFMRHIVEARSIAAEPPRFPPLNR